jgi:superfamily II RNA helicase
MVIICPYIFSNEEEKNYEEHFNKYSYTLQDFQKWSIKSIVDGNHVLICAPTGSGKTLPGEFALNFFHKKGKKTIYTTPVKALSNEKFYNFNKKYPNITIGLITGDIKTNPDADVLIMTTEILMNKLYQIKSKNPNVSSSVSFEMDIERELGCVIFDEIHMINDESRGHVWEQSIMLMPLNIQIIGLSATLDNPEKFAFWLETKGDISNKIEKKVCLVQKQVRSVPLIHYSFITANKQVFKTIKDKEIQNEIRKYIDIPLIIQDEKGIINEKNYLNITKTLKIIENNNIKIKRHYTLNKVTEYMFEKNMLPALVYVFSKKNLEKCAEELNTNLLEFDSKIPYIIDRECEQIIRKLPNYDEYLHLPEYLNLVKLLRKGIGIHHAGLLSVLREMVELLFSKGFIKILFCTETMSVGINLPVKTTIFTDLNKYNGSIFRNLYSHEYIQAAGRAGRLGLDTEGHVIHLNNLFKNIDFISYKEIMSSKPQILKSKFKISYNLLLNLIDIGNKNIILFASKSMITGDIEVYIKDVNNKITKLQNEIDNLETYINNLKTPIEIINKYIELNNNKNIVTNKKRKETERIIKNLIDNYKYLEQDKLSYEKKLNKQKELNELQTEYDSLNSYFKVSVNSVLNLLIEENFIDGNLTEDTSLKLTIKGKIATQIKELHCLVFSKLYNEKILDRLSSKQLAALFSCFTEIRVQEDLREELKGNFAKSIDKNDLDIMVYVSNLYDYYKNEELLRNINTGFDYEINYDLFIYINKWCEAENTNECKLVLQELSIKKNIFLGEFVKALLKINNIVNEFENIAELTGNIELLSKLKEIPNITLKYIATTQSLYV